MSSIPILVNTGDRNMQGGMRVTSFHGEQGLSLSYIPQVFFQRYSCNVLLPYLIQLNFTSQYQQPSPFPGLAQQTENIAKQKNILYNKLKAPSLSQTNIQSSRTFAYCWSHCGFQVHTDIQYTHILHTAYSRTYTWTGTETKSTHKHKRKGNSR